MDSSVADVARDFLVEFGRAAAEDANSGERPIDVLRALRAKLIARGSQFSASDNLPGRALRSCPRTPRGTWARWQLSACFSTPTFLIYSVSQNPAEAAKQMIAEALVARSDCAVSVQVLNEFFHQITRRSRRNRLSAEEAWEFLKGWRKFAVQDLTTAVLDDAYIVLQRTNFSWWDCLISLPPGAIGATVLCSEDLDDGRIIDGMRIVNPFAKAATLP